MLSETEVMAYQAKQLQNGLIYCYYFLDSRIKTYIKTYFLLYTFFCVYLMWIPEKEDTEHYYCYFLHEEFLSGSHESVGIRCFPLPSFTPSK